MMMLSFASINVTSTLKADTLVPPSRPHQSQLATPSFAVKGPSFDSEALPSSRARYISLLHAEAKARGLPPEIADTVARIESGYNSAAIGADGERGMMQVMPPTATMLGFRGSREQLAEPATNIRLGVEYLAGAWKLAGGDLCRALMKYRAGHNQERMSALSVEYCRRAKSHLAALGSPFGAGAVPAPDLGDSRVRPSVSLANAGNVGHVQRSHGRSARVMPVRTAETSRRFWADHEARIRAVRAQLPWVRREKLARG